MRLSATGGVVQHGILTFEQDEQTVAVPVGTPAWYTWLETATAFTFVSEAGQFTAHKTPAGNRRGGWYWRAYRRKFGRLSSSYLGVSANLTLSCLQDAAHRLAASTEGTSGRQQATAPGPLSSSSTLAPSPILHILHTKCAIPRLPVQHVPRAHLVALLEQGAAGPLTLVSAPAGSGKTTLLAEWARATPMPAAWLSLEAADGDPTRFGGYLIAALHQLDEQIGRAAETLLHTRSTPDLEGMLSSLINDLAHALTTDVALVLDDYHAIESEAVQAALLFLLDHLPEQLHLILGTRVDPSFPLARWRARGHLGEIRAETLRFAPTEMQTFLREMHVELSGDALDSLERRTEGWVAGVQLAALALRGHDDPAAFLSGFRGDHRFVQEYIGGEILASQTPQVRDFLLQTSILERLSGPLCDAVTASTGSQAMLEELRKANLFVSALDEAGEWYRYHALFADSLRHQLLQQKPELFPQLCVRASEWYEGREMLYEACEYALQGSDYQRAARLVERQMSRLVGSVQFALLHRWLEQLPSEIIASRPLLGVAATWASLIEEGNEIENLARRMHQLQQSFREQEMAMDRAEWVEAQAHINFIRLLQAMGKNDADEALRIAWQTLQSLPADATYLRSLTAVSLGLAEGIGYRLGGDYVAAERVLIEASTQTNATQYHFLNLVASNTLLEMYEAQGELQKLAHLYQRLLQMARAHQETPPEMVVWACTGYAKLLLDWYRFDEAEAYIRQALAAEQRTQIKDLTLACRFVQLWISQARDNDEETQELIHSLEKDLARLSLAQRVTGFDALWRVRLLLSQGSIDEAARWASGSGLRYDDPFTGLPDEDLFFAKYATLARVLIAQGRSFPREAYLPHALTLLDRFCSVYEKADCTGRVIEILILTALALQAQGKTQPALATLGRALSLAEPAGYVRVFVVEGQPMARLLALVSSHTTASPGYLQKLRTATSPAPKADLEMMPHAPDASPVNPLSTREREVLALLVAGSSNQQIANHLIISLNTAKRHVKHILAKLAATNRTQAIARARELHLI